MGAENLATVMAPNLLRRPRTGDGDDFTSLISDTSSEKNFVLLCINSDECHRSQYHDEEWWGHRVTMPEYRTFEN